MQNELDIVCDVSHRLDEAKISYMLTGSMAMNYYAQPRMTRDIDVVVALRPMDAERLVKLFSPDYYVSSEAVNSSIANQSMFNLIHNESVIKVDCIVRKQNEYRLTEFNRRHRLEEMAERLHGSCPNFMTQADLRRSRQDHKWETAK